MDEIPVSPGIYEQVLQPRNQRYTLAIPDGYTHQHPRPLIIALHWGGPGAVIGGLAAGALIGGSLAYGAYPPAYYGPGPGYVQAYPDNYVDDYDYGSYAGNDDATAYCVQRFRSYDPSSGTYLGYDGQRHPCP